MRNVQLIDCLIDWLYWLIVWGDFVLVKKVFSCLILKDVMVLTVRVEVGSSFQQKGSAGAITHSETLASIGFKLFFFFFTLLYNINFITITGLVAYKMQNVLIRQQTSITT